MFYIARTFIILAFAIGMVCVVTGLLIVLGIVIAKDCREKKK